ncbi:hypothetical protein U8607_06540 [Methylobacterium durans]|uniref:hypothetical protein n=1 Tax=Methylobacterium durans TaxID=2202825 RepID=UPI002AFFF80A|nr:hypothetical protein [Methylobacterium durans]MEA1831739.1 hypothetical protein [Methylobacterium durans]
MRRYAVTESVNEIWAGFNDATRILRAAQFARRDVIELTGLTDAQLKNTLDRDLVRLDSTHNPGTGRRRMFTGSDVLKITVAHTMSGIGFPMRWSYLVADEVARRASERLVGIDNTPGLVIATYPMASGDWARIPMWEGKEEPKLPIAVQLLQVDRMIDEVLAKLRALVADEPIPSFAVEEPKPYDLREMFCWQDPEMTVLVGLSREETVEFFELSELKTQDMLSETKSLITDEQEDRLQELNERYDKASILVPLKYRKA